MQCATQCFVKARRAGCLNIAQSGRAGTLRKDDERRRCGTLPRCMGCRFIPDWPQSRKGILSRAATCPRLIQLREIKA